MENNLLDTIENLREFLTIDELNNKIISLGSPRNLINLGKSKNGNLIIGIKIGIGKENALVFGFPHPNEPVGSLTCIELIKILLKNKELQNRYTWYIIPCVDPDGAKLNEGWFKGKFTIKKYVYHFYRPQGKNQIDWSFPIKYKDYEFSKPTKETKVLLKLMNRFKPKVVYPLHNAGFGGAFFYITQNMPSPCYEEIISLCKKLSIPIDYGEPEVEYVKELKKPFYLAVSFEEIYDYFEKSGEKPKEILNYGTSSIGYAKKLNPDAFGIVGEIPYIYDPQIFNEKKMSETRRNFLKEKYDVRLKTLNFIDENIKHKGINQKSVFYPLVKDIIKQDKERLRVFQKNIERKEYSRYATVAEKFSSLVISRFYLSLLLGRFRRLLLDSERNVQIEELKRKTENEITDLMSYIEKNSDYKTLPIKKLVQLQLGCLFISLNYI